jgi:hypothetical protein
MLRGIVGCVVPHHRVAAALVLLAGCAQGVEDNIFSSASQTASVSDDAGTNDDDDGESESGRDGSSSGIDPMDTGGDGITGPVDDDGTTEGEADDGQEPTIGPLDDTGSEGPVDPTNDPTLDDGAMDDGALPAGDCCVAHGGLGCDDPGVEACVCALDDICCSSGWDDICVQEAGQCGAPCMGGGGDCCAVQAVPGCSDPALEACVCAFDDFCCSTQWDDVCVDEAVQLCGAPC